MLTKHNVHRSSLKSYLDKPVHPDVKAIIIKKFKVILYMPTHIDSDPPDYYRYLGQQVIRLKLIEELNSFIMEHCNTYPMLRPWPKELWDLRENYLELREATEKILRALLHEGINTGFYKEPERDCTMKGLI